MTLSQTAEVPVRTRTTDESGDGCAVEHVRPLNTGHRPAPNCVRVEFLVSVPVDTPSDRPLNITGSHPTFGQWRPDGLRLLRRGPQEYHAAIDLPRNEPVEFKFTTGSWSTVEKSRNGTDIHNRSIQPISGMLLLANVERWGVCASAPAPSQPSKFRLHRSFPSRTLRNKRDVTVYIPPGYDEDAERRYSVLYMHDGQNLFTADRAFGGISWRLRETADRLISAGAIEPIIIVGVDHTPNRLNEYTPQL